MAGPSDSNERPRIQGDTAPITVAREYMESMGMAPTEAPKGAKPVRHSADPVRWKRLMGHALAMGERIVASTEPRVELLVRALETRGIPIPGVASWSYRHGVTANGQNIITYLEKRFAHVPTLAQQVQVACFRFHELVEAVGIARTALEANDADDDQLEDLKLKTYFVTHFHDHLKDDPLMRQLFPPPIEAPKKTTGSIGTDQITRYRQAREACLRRAESMMRSFGPGIERARRMVGLAKQDRGSALLGLLNPNDMRERQLVKKLREKGQMGVLEELAAIADRVPPAMTRVRDGGQYEPLEELLERMSAVYDTRNKDALLAEVLPAPSDTAG